MSLAQTTLSRPEPQTIRSSDFDELELPESIYVPSEHFGVDGLLGVGGMGCVHAAQQYSLNRSVAVKTVKAAAGRDCELALVREAMVTSRLEHPNIVPIYTIGTSDSGRPAIILRKISGTPWSELLGDPERVEAEFGRSDLLAWNIEVLLEVTNAVRFAHSEGVLHRDIKPSNVLIGRFGEVYLCDWGIAVSLNVEDAGILELASTVRSPAGTVPYMAPEMSEPHLASLSERSDIYLLGAVLYEILEGTAPNARGGPASPKFSGQHPLELKDASKRCLMYRPKERFEAVEDLQQALRAYLSHRGSHQLTERGAKLVGRLGKLIQLEVGAGQREEIYSTLRSCRMVLQEATTIWPGNEVARTTMQTAIAQVVEYELRNNEVASAASLLVELDSEDERLHRWVERALEAQHSERREYSVLRQEADRTLGGSSRRKAIVCLGLGWVLVPLLLANLLSNTTYLSQFVSHLGFVVLWLGLGGLGRDWIQATSVNRDLFRTLLSGGLLAIAFNAGSAIAGIEPAQAQVYHLFIFFSIGVAVAVTIEERAWPTALGFLCAYLVSARWPELTLWFMAAANLGLVLNALVIWDGVKVEEVEPNSRGSSCPLRST